MLTIRPQILRAEAYVGVPSSSQSMAHCGRARLVVCSSGRSSTSVSHRSAAGLAHLGDLLEDPHQGILADIDRVGGPHPAALRSRVALVFTASREAPAAVSASRVEKSYRQGIDAVPVVG